MPDPLIRQLMRTFSGMRKSVYAALMRSEMYLMTPFSGLN